MVKRKKSIKSKIAVFITLFFCLLVGVGYLLFFSPIFLVREIVVAGNQEIASQQIQDIARREINKKIFGFLPKNTVFLIDVNDLKQAILQGYGQISQVTLNTQSVGWQGAKLGIVVQERQPQAIVCRLQSDISTSTPAVLGDCFYVDQQGIAFKSAPQTKGSLILQLAAPYDLTLSAEAVKPPTLQAAEQLKKALTEAVPDLLIDYFIIISSQEIFAKTQASWLIYFDINTNLVHQAQILKELLKQKLTNTKNLQYIDLRLGEKVFYKNVSEPTIAR